MSREAIRLTSKEHRAASEAAQRAIDKGKRHFGVVDAIMVAVNEIREGDPVGTIRRDDNGEVWVCVHHGCDNWHGVAVTGATIWTDDEGVEGIPVIYNPGDAS